MKLLEFIRRMMHYVYVPRCVHCNEILPKDSETFCPSCLSQYENVKQRNCARCANILSRCTCTNDYLDRHLVHRLLKIVRYVSSIKELPQNRLIFSMKRENREDVARFMSKELSDAIRANIKDHEKYVLAYVPRRRSEKRKYGVDQAKILAEHISKSLHIELVHALRPKSKKAQKKLSAVERRKNASFSPRKNADLSGKRVLLLDDIVTTGATMGAAAMALRSVGAREIVGVCFAIAYLDPHVELRNSVFDKA